MRTLLTALVLLLVCSCARVPEESALRRDVEARIALALPPGSVEIAGFRRRGSQRDAEAPEGTTRRIVYVELELRLLRDYDFGAWDGPGVAGLLSALGSGPRGLKGIQTGGNRAGDVIDAHGALRYEQRDDGWVALEPSGFAATPAPAAALAATSSDTLLGALKDALSRVPPDASPAVREALRQELQHAYAAVQARLARAERGYAIAAGPEGGQYLRLVQAFAADPATRIVPLVTGGGDENLALLREGRVDLALSQGDAVLAAYRGDGRFASAGPFPNLRTIGVLYPEVVHVVARRDTGPGAMAELRGRRIAIGGAEGSSARDTAHAVLAAHGLAGAVELQSMAAGAALRALREGTVDAVITVIGIPADGLRVAATEMALRLLPLDDDAIRELTTHNPAYLPFEIPGSTYAGATETARSIATPALLLANPDLSNAEIETITAGVYGGKRDLVALGSAQGAQVSLARASSGLPVPQHAAALKTLGELRAGSKPPR